MDRKYFSVDMGKFFFSCLIPFLHIPFDNNCLIYFVRQYISRFGVPFFFVASGFFLSSSIKRRGSVTALKRYEKRILHLLVLWLIIYSPILLRSMDSPVSFVKELLFLTPAYLWYLSALVFAAIPFCLISNRKLLWLFSAIFYFIGTLFSGSYSWFSGGIPAYTSFFLTTRNGLFFALPLLCVGEFAHIGLKISGIATKLLFAASAIIVFLEISYVGHNVSSSADRSMYFSLPVFSYFLFICIKNANCTFNSTFWGNASISIYLMQYGIIFIFSRLYVFTGFSLNSWGIITLIAVIFSGMFAYWISRKNKFLRYLF